MVDVDIGREFCDVLRVRFGVRLRSSMDGCLRRSLSKVFEDRLWDSTFYDPLDRVVAILHDELCGVI